MSCVRVGASWIPLLLCTLATAAEPPPAATPPAAPPAVEEPPLREQTIYVPYSKLQKIFEKQGRGVFLPYEEFQKLWTQARAAMAEKPDEKPPVEALIAEIDSEATVGEEVVNVTAKLKIEVLADGWHEVPLRLADAAIFSARQADQAARVTFKPEAGYVLLVHKQSPQPELLDITLQYAKTFTKSPGQNAVAFQAPQAPVNQWRIRVPQAGVKVNVQPLVAATQVPPNVPEGGVATETVVQAFVGAAPQVQIDWTPKAEGAAGLEAVATVQSEQQITIDEGVVRTRTALTYAISRAEMSQLVIEAPADHKVLNVFDPNVREWKVEPQEGGVSKIAVQLYQPAKESQRVVIEMERFSDDMLKQPVVVPVVKAVGVGRQQGVLVVRVAPTLRAETAQRTGVLQLDASELPGELAGGKWDFSYRFPAVPFELSLSVEKVMPQIRTHELVEAYLEPERLTINLLALYQIERAGVFQLELDVPAGFEIRSVRGHAAAGAEAAVVDTHHATGADGTHLVVNLARKALGHVGLFVELQRRLEDPNLLTPTGAASDIPLPLPRVSPAGIERSTGRMILYAPESLRVKFTKQDGVQPISSAEALEGTASTREGRFPSVRDIQGFAYTQGPVDVALNVERLQPFIEARQLLVARVEAGVIVYDATFFFNIRYSGVQSLRLDVPATLASEIRNQDPKTISDEPIDPPPADVADGYVAWRLKGEGELLGEVVAKFSWQKKLGDLPVAKAVEESLPYLRPMPKDLVKRSWGQIVIAKAETLDVRPAGELDGLRPIDPQTDLMPGAAVPDAARAFEFQADWNLKVAITRYELIEVKRTSIERAVVRMEATRSKELSVQALYRMRSAQSRLPLVLPSPTEIKFDTDPLRINGRSVALGRGEQGQYFVPLAGQKADEPFLLELRYTVPGDVRRLDLPSFPDKPAIQKVYFCVYVPQEWTVLGSRGPWTDEMSWRWYELLSGVPRSVKTDAELVGWVVEGLSVPNPFADFDKDGRLHTFSTLEPAAPPAGSLQLVTIHKLVQQGVVLVVVLLVGLLAIRRPAPQKLALVVLSLMVLLIASVFLPIMARQIMDGALLSAVFVVFSLWFLRFLFRTWPIVAGAFARRPSPPPTPPPAAPAEAESPFAPQPTVPDAKQTIEAGDSAASGNAQEGGRSDG